MKKVIRLSESELISVIKKIISEQPSKGPLDVFKELEDGVTYSDNEIIMDENSVTLGNKTLSNLGADWTNFYKSKIKGKKISEVHKFGNKLHITVDKSSKKNPLESETYRFEIKNPQ